MLFVNLGVMKTEKSNSRLPKATEVEPHQQMQFSIMLKLIEFKSCKNWKFNFFQNKNIHQGKIK